MKENLKEQKDKDHGQKCQKLGGRSKKEERHQHPSRRDSVECIDEEEDMEDYGHHDSSEAV
jgi:hypothetical protein